MMSSRKAAGSRRGNGRRSRPSDAERPAYRIGEGLPPAHESRFASVLTCWPLAPGQTAPARRW